METVADSVATTNRALCVEEGRPTYGVAAEIAARVQHACFDDLDAPVTRVGMMARRPSRAVATHVGMDAGTHWDAAARS